MGLARDVQTPVAAMMTSDTVPPPTLQVDAYRIGRLLGAGGGGEVHEAVDVRTGDRVALKLLPRLRAADHERGEELLREAAIADRIQHPGVVPVIEYGRDAAGTAYVAMERLAGEALDARLARGKPTRAEALDILRGVLEALEATHRAGVLHRDLKPGNVFLQRRSDGTTQVTLIDFGLATEASGLGKATRRVSGTPAYMAPERLLGHPGRRQSDLYGVGAIAYEMFTGQTPYGDEPTRIFARQARELPPADPTDRRLSRWVARMLSTRWFFRPFSATSARRALSGIAGVATTAPRIDLAAAPA